MIERPPRGLDGQTRRGPCRTGRVRLVARQICGMGGAARVFICCSRRPCFDPPRWGDAEEAMSSGNLASRSIAALAGASMLVLSLSPASALTIAGPSLERSVASAQVDKVWWRGGWGWRGGLGWRGGWGYRGWGWRGGRGYAGWRGPGWGPGYYGPGWGYWGPGLCGRSSCY